MQMQDLYPQILDQLMGRSVPNDKIYEYLFKTIMEFTEDYKFTELGVTGPLVQLTPFQVQYDPADFLLDDSDLNPNPPPSSSAPSVKIKKVNSFFLYLDPVSPPVTPIWPYPDPVANRSSSRSGYNLAFRTIDRMEVLLNVPGIPQQWTRHNQRIWIASPPNQAYWIFMRYQQSHPFPNAGDPVLKHEDLIWMPDSWQDILEYATSQRLAQIYNLSSKATELNQRLLGDQKFQETSGVEGQPGLIFRRTSDESRDQMTTVKRFRLRMGQR